MPPAQPSSRRPVRSRSTHATILALLSLSLPAIAQQPPTPVAVCPVHEREVPASVKLVGTVLADQTAVIAAEVAGRVAEYAVREGAYLKKGDVICRLDRELGELRLAEARSRLDSLRAQLAELENGTRKEIVARFRAANAEAEAMLQKWSFERDRIRRLFEAGQGSEKEQHDTEMEYLAAQRRVAQSGADLEAAENGPRREEIDRARFDVAAQEQVVAQLERDLRKAEIRAAFAGFITARRSEVGEWVEMGGPVADMVAIDTVRVRVDVPESAVRFARVDEPVRLEFDALSRELAATITRVIPQANAQARTFPVEIEIENGDHGILPGMFVWAFVPAGPPGKRLMISRDAIVPRGTTKTIYVVRSQGEGPAMATPMLVTTGLEIEGEVEVQADGLRPGDQVVCRANERLMGPTPVVPAPLGGAEPAAPKSQPALAGAKASEAPAEN